MKEFDISYQQKELNISGSSINSNPELKHFTIFYLRILLIIINIISLILGCYIYQDKEYYLNPEYKFDYIEYLEDFLIIYSFGMISTLIFAFILSLIIKICVFILNKFSKNNNSNQLINNEERPPTENSFRFINAYTDEIALIPYTLTLFIVTTSIIYFLSLPYSIFLFIFLQKDKIYSSLKNFKMLYSFLVINLIAGFIIFYVILIVVFVKREGSFRKEKIAIDDINLENFKEEIKNAMRNAEQ